MISGDWIDLGDGVSIAFYAQYDTEPVEGLLWRHDCPGDPRGPESRGDPISFNPPDPTGWTVEHWVPLTLSPSLRCTVCGRHGFIRAGRWVPA